MNWQDFANQLQIRTHAAADETTGLFSSHSPTGDSYSLEQAAADLTNNLMLAHDMEAKLNSDIARCSDALLVP